MPVWAHNNRVWTGFRREVVLKIFRASQVRPIHRSYRIMKTLPMVITDL